MQVYLFVNEMEECHAVKFVQISTQSDAEMSSLTTHIVEMLFLYCKKNLALFLRACFSDFVEPAAYSRLVT